MEDRAPIPNHRGRGVTGVVVVGEGVVYSGNFLEHGRSLDDKGSGPGGVHRGDGERRRVFVAVVGENGPYSARLKSRKKCQNNNAHVRERE